MPNITYQCARNLYDQGISVCPAQVDGSKKSRGRWKQYQERRCSRQQLAQWFDRAEPWAIAVVCGEVSQKLLVIDIDDSDLIDPFESALKKNHPDLYKRMLAGEEIGYHKAFKMYEASLK